MKKLFKLLLALLLLPAFTFAQTKIDAAEIIAKINRGETVNYKNVQVQGDLDLTQLANKKLKQEDKNNDHSSKEYISTVTGPLSFSNCTFTGKVLGYYNPDANKMNVMHTSSEIYNTNFEKEVRFEKCTFAEEVAFKYSKFNGPVSFAGSTFKEETIFKYAHFNRGSADFSKTVFEEGVVFKYVNLQEGINFTNARFKDDADFKYAKFPKGSSFQEATFTGHADFKYAQFTGSNLKGIAFKEGSQDFKYTQVDGRQTPLTVYSK